MPCPRDCLGVSPSLLRIPTQQRHPPCSRPGPAPLRALFPAQELRVCLWALVHQENGALGALAADPPKEPGPYTKGEGEQGTKTAMCSEPHSPRASNHRPETSPHEELPHHRTFLWQRAFMCSAFR